MIESLLRVVKIFRQEKVEYCVIGGLAMLLHHGRANTIDIDFYVLVEELDRIRDIFQKNHFKICPAGDFQLKGEVDGVPVDFLLADHYIGRDVVIRAVEKKLGDDLVRVATPEDLIILKTLANRSVDRRDVEELRELFQGRLDEKYIKRNLSRLKKTLKVSLKQ